MNKIKPNKTTMKNGARGRALGIRLRQHFADGLAELVLGAPGRRKGNLQKRLENVKNKTKSNQIKSFAGGGVGRCGSRVGGFMDGTDTTYGTDGTAAKYLRLATLSSPVQPSPGQSKQLTPDLNHANHFANGVSR